VAFAEVQWWCGAVVQWWCGRRSGAVVVWWCGAVVVWSLQCTDADNCGRSVALLFRNVKIKKRSFSEIFEI
jgi:hypothetical protein